MSKELERLKKEARARKETKKSTILGRQVSNRTLIIVGIISACIIGGLIIWAVASGLMGGFFFGEPPPAEKQVGYSQIVLYDSFNDSEIPSGTVDIYVFDWYNETNYTTVKNGETFKVNNLSFGFVMLSGYNNETFWISANPDINDPHINTIQILRLPDMDDVSLRIVNIKGTWGDFSATDLPTGYYDVQFELKIVNTSKVNSSLGSSTGLYYIPEPFRRTLTTNFNVTTGSLWFGFDGSVSDVKIFNEAIPTYDTTTYNMTALETRTSGDDWFPLITVSLNVTSSINSIILVLGEIDDYPNPIITL